MQADWIKVMIAATRLPLRSDPPNNHDINTVANTARIMVQDVADVFAVIEKRWSDSPAVA
ncbi:hypothetical protein [Pseudomonas poae]|uniref:hypothetical protein n=1 Tax=Pseudomonas poae TaxID=200451 RepID=UPI0026884961